MAQKPSAPAPKKKTHIAGSILDFAGYWIGQAALPVPDMLFEKSKKKAGKPKK